MADVTLKIKGDSTDARQAVGQLTGSLRGMGSTALRASGDVLKMTAAVLGAESAVAGLRMIFNGAKEGLREYVEANEDARQALGGVGEALSGVRQQIGAVILGGENAAIVSGLLATAVDALTLSNDDLADAQQFVRRTLAAVIDAAAVAVDVVAVLRTAWGGLRVAVIATSAVLESILSAIGFVTASLIDGLGRALLFVVDGFELAAESAARVTGAIPGVGSAAQGAAEFLNGATDAMGESLDRVRQHAFAAQEGIGQAFRDMRPEIEAVAAETQQASASIAGLADRMRNLADDTRSGAIAQRALRGEIEQTAAAAQRAAVGGGASAAQSALQEALAAAAAEQAAKEAAIAEQRANFSQAKADQMIAAEEAIVAAREAALVRQQEIDAALAASLERRAEIARSSGEAIGESLAVAVQGQRDASKQIIAIIARELAARISAAVATAGIFAATPGGQFAAAAIGAAVTAAAATLSQIGGGGGGRRERQSAGTSIGSVNVTIQGGTAMTQREIEAAVTEGVRRGTLRIA